MAENRRDFLKRAGGTTAALGLPVLGAKGVGAAVPEPENRLAARRRRRPGSRLLLELGNELAGPVGSDSSGGFAFAEVVSERLGPDRVIKKHLGPISFADIAVSVGAGMSPGFYQWIQHQVIGFQRKDGSLVTVDGDFRERRRLVFSNALLREVTFPAVDANSSEPVTLEVKIEPELTRDQPGSGQLVGGSSARPRRWLASDFRLKIDGLEDATRHALRVEALPLRAIVQNELGDQRDYEKEPAYLDVPNLVFTVPEAAAQPLVDWVDSFVIRGNCSDADEKSGTLEYLGEDGATVLFTLRFGHLGIFRLAPAGTEGRALLKAEMYCETLGFEFPNTLA